MSKQEERPNEITWLLLESLGPKECAMVIENIEKYVKDIEYENIILDERLEELEKKLKFRDDILFCISETLVDESKMNVTTKCAIKRIREYMCKLNDERKYIDEELEDGQ